MKSKRVRHLQIPLSDIKKQLQTHPFIVPRGFQNTYYQTIVQVFLPHFKSKNWKIEKRIIAVPDGTKLVVDCIFQKNFTQGPTVLVVNGFLGGSDSHFPLQVGHKAFYLGYNVILLNQRGQGDTMHLTKSICDSGLEGDLQFVFKAIHQWGCKEVYVVATSYGGFLCVLEIGKMGEKAKEYISGLAVISSAVDTIGTPEHMNNYPFFKWYVVKEMKKIVKKRIKADPPGTWDKKVLRKIKTWREWDETYLYTFGNDVKFSNVDEYFEYINALKFIPQIVIPTLMIHAEDDPIAPLIPFASKEFQRNPNIITLINPYGGHTGFISLKKRYGDLDCFWAQNRAFEFFQLLRSHNLPQV